MITPTVGRIVYFHPPADLSTPGFNPDSSGICAAIVVKVHSPVLVNLIVFDSLGRWHPFTSVPLVQEGDAIPEKGNYCEWMPYQKAVAKGEIAPTLHAEPTGTMASLKIDPAPSPFSSAHDPVVETPQQSPVESNPQ